MNCSHQPMPAPICASVYGITHTPKTLANRRHLGLAPTFVRVARRWPRYTKKSLDAYAEVPAKKE